MDLYLCLAILGALGHNSQAAKCYRSGKEVCCSGYRLNQTSGLCNKCPTGYSGLNCAYQCHYPSYGEDCAKTCSCPMKLCDYAFGCFHNSSTVREKTSDSGHFEETTETSLALTTSRSTSIVLYTTIALISIFVIFALFYGVSNLRNFISSRREGNTSGLELNLNESGNSMYQCVEYPRYI